MKMSIIQFLSICLLLTGITAPALVYSDSSIPTNTNAASTTITNKHKTPNSNRTLSTTQKLADRKEILIDDSRDLSAFFTLGIIINIIMAITFGWWFSKEWRRQKM